LVAQGMMGGVKVHYDGIVAFSQTDFTEDLKKITVPVLVMHGDDDQVVPYADSGPLTAKLLKNSTLKTYKGFPHGMPTTQAETTNADLHAGDENKSKTKLRFSFLDSSLIPIASRWVPKFETAAAQSHTLSSALEWARGSPPFTQNVHLTLVVGLTGGEGGGRTHTKSELRGK
jgi:dienelactone hydrolase